MKDLAGSLVSEAKSVSPLDLVMQDGRVQAVRARREDRAARARGAEAQHRRLSRVFVAAT